MSDLSLPKIGSGDSSVDIMIDQVLTPTDVRIIDVVAHIGIERGKAPSASEIKDELSKSNELKKTQLYERLNRLARFGFLSVKQLPRPRRYLVSHTTIVKGVEQWVEEQRTSITSLSSELEAFLDLLRRMDTKTFAAAITSKLSIGFEST